MSSSAAILLHGFTGRPQNWDRLIDLLRSDPEIGGRFEFVPFEYPTRLFQMSVRRRIPDVSELANALGEFIDSPEFYDKQITLIGHSQGGLVVQQYLADKVERGRAKELEPIRQVVFFATPLEGSIFASGMRRLLFSVFPNPQERSLRVLARDTGDAQRVVRERIAGASGPSDTEYPIPIRCFWGMEDRIVLRQSAEGSYYEGSAIPGDHTTIIQPRDTSDARYKETKEALLFPIGHPAVFEVDEYAISISVKPLEPGTKVTCTYSHGSRTIRSDTKGIVRQRVRFSRKNRCDELFTLRYGTEERGALRANTSRRNEAGAEDLLEYERVGTPYVFKFRPEAGKEDWLQVEAYKAFDEGNEDFHLHLRKPGQESRYRRVSFELDLTRYAESGYGFGDPAVLHFRSADPGDHSDTEAAAMGDVLEAEPGTGPGLWRWAVSDVSAGVVDIRWKHTLVPPSPAATEPLSTV
jgi:pimeloyl-ACP methyl ester carboxylesterase